MKFLMLFVDGFEDTEAISTMDVLKRGGQVVDCLSLMESKNIKPKFSPGFVCDLLKNDANFDSYDGLIIPGGPGSFQIMPNLEIVSKLIKKFADSNKLVAAICAAPHLVGKLGYFKNKNFTVHPGFEQYVIGGTYLRDKGVVEDGNFITAKSMYYSIEFGLTIYQHFYGKGKRDLLEKSLQGEK